MSNIDKIRQQLMSENLDLKDERIKELVNQSTINVFHFMMHEDLPITDAKVVDYIDNLRKNIATLTSHTPTESRPDELHNFKTINIEFAGDHPMDFTLAKDIKWGSHLLKAGTKLSFRSAGGPECYYTFDAVSPTGEVFTIYEPERNLPKDIPILEE